jgi:hypothetical protein
VTWLDDQSILRDLLLMPAPRDDDLARLGGPRWLVYRRMVRARFATVLAEAFEDFRTAVGPGAFADLVDRFLAESPPRSPYLRDIPLEFHGFLQGYSGRPAGHAAWPAFALDLARFEAATAELAHLATPTGSSEVEPLDMHLFAVLSPTARLLDLQHAVHVFDAEHRDVPLRPVTLLIYRAASTGEVETLEMNPVASRIVRGIAREEAPLVEVVRIAAGEASVAIDASFVESFSILLADLVERGVVLGSRGSR